MWHNKNVAGCLVPKLVLHTTYMSNPTSHHMGTEDPLREQPVFASGCLHSVEQVQGDIPAFGLAACTDA